MATIRNSIQLQDRMTPVFRSIIKSMDSTLKVMKDLDRQANNGGQSREFLRAEKNIKKAHNALLKMQSQTDRANKSMNSLATSTERVSNGMSRLHSGGFNLVNLSAAFYLIKNIKQLLDGIMEAPDSALSTKARLGLFNESQYTNDQLYGQVYQTSLATRTGIEDTGNLATRILISGAMEGEGAAAGALKVTELINKALIAGGGTSEENRRSLLQLSQGLASGMLQGDELRAIREQTPYLAKILAEGLGKIDENFIGTTIGDLKRLGGEGELTSERIIKSFLAMEDTIDESFKKMPRTFGQGMTQLGSIWKYFLYLLGEGEGALAKINQKVWQLADYLTTAEGSEFLNDMAFVFSVIVHSILWGIDRIVEGITWLREHTEVLNSILFALGTLFIITAGTAAAAWISASWPILLVAGIVGLVTLKLMEMGLSAGEILGTIAGGFLFLGYAIVGTATLVVTSVITIISVIWNIIQALLSVVWNIILGIRTAIETVFLLLGGAVAIVLSGIVTDFTDMGMNVLSILHWIASGIDLVFGSSLATTVTGWMDSLGAFRDDLVSKLDTSELPTEVVNMWKNADWMAMDWAAVDPLASQKWATDKGLLADPMNGWNAGKSWGIDLVDGLKNFEFGDPNSAISTMLKDWSADTVTMGGGTLDKIGEVGSIKSDVNIADEDIKLLRDMAAKEFLLNLTSVTPQANITFGDVRETADVNKILSVIEDMVDNAFATSLTAD